MKNFLLLIVLISFPLYAQVDTLTNRNDLENLFEDSSEGQDESYNYDVLEYLTENPILLNNASIKDLLKIPFINLTTATAIIRHRNLLGGIYDVDQLKFIEGVSFETIEKILPFIKLGDEQPLSFTEIFESKIEDIKLNIRSRGIYDLQKEEAFRTGKFPNSRWKIYNRFFTEYSNKFRVGALIEKDPGEKNLNDFTTFHLQLKNLDLINNIVIGDYIFEFGQGLALWSRYAFSKGSEVVDILPRNSRGIVPYLSTDENQFFRGVALTTNLSQFSLSAFFSSRFLDASVDSTSNLITALRIDGLHRTENEIRKKDNVNEKLFGAALEITFEEYGNLNFLFYKSLFSNSFFKNSILDPDENQFNYFSTSYSFGYNKFNLTGETAFNGNGLATLNSFEINIDKNFAIIFSYRNYSKEYWNIHSNGFGERDFAQNEIGFYSGLRLKTIYGTFNFYFDQFKFPYVSEKYPFSSKGNDLLIYYTIKPFKNSELRLRYKNEIKEIATSRNEVYSLIGKRTQNIRGEFIFSPITNLKLRSRLEFVNVSSPLNNLNDKGYLIFQDINYKPIKNLSLATRVIFFRTDSYDSRVYEFENDLIGVMTNPALYGDGMRWYFLIRYQTNFGFNISLKYSELYKPNEKFLGSGDSKINGNIDNRFSLQFEYKL
ncbi:MAG: helix-hairpin-helix domain-containing protein [Melioribacteraceae bacterium]|nr:helix-hairpin-helix domain-containing protein [Melioribacteraceae bacterium]